ncbi:hypothetical protein SUGI_0000500 [Cryptomeria japonica]|nr:hypothetical protein SUGI_0000500 [Cryptomeria japonica]
MGQSSQTLGGGDEEDLNTTTNGPQAEATESKSKKLKLVPLIFLIYFEVSGGPFGEEPAVKAAGPLLALLGFIIFPFIWSIPEALVTAELATAYPGNGGYVVWAWAAFGPFWGFLMGWWKWISGRSDPALHNCPELLEFHGPQYRGLDGRYARGDMDWSLYFNTLFWNLNFWDNASTLAGEVDNPQRTFPRALLCAGLLTCVGYILPLLAGTGALELNRDLWTDGYLAEAAGLIAGSWLKYWIELGAVLSTVGLFEAQLSSASFQLLGMAEIGLLPSAMAKRSSYNTPFLGILFSAGGTLLLSYLSFTTIISAANFLYSCGMLLEFASFLWLRRKFPALKRPYRVPTGIPGLLCMCAVPVAFLIFVMTLADSAVYVLSISVTVAGILGYFLMKTCKKRNWIDFADGIGESENRNDAQSVYEGLLHSQ